jgi:hypothetical protein
MSTAILISGQLRTFAKCWPTQRWHVLRHFADPHFFITVQFDQAEIIAELIKEYGKDRVHYDPRTDPDLTPHLTPELARAYHQAPYANAAPTHQLLLQHWYQNECWKRFEDVRGQKSEGWFHTVIRMRADLWFHSFEPPQMRGHDFDIWTIPHPNECHTPAWGEFGGINVRFAIMGPEAARYYFTVWDHIPELLAAGCPFHPESLVAANLERGNVTLHRILKTFFSTIRPPGDPRGEQRWPEITPMDMLNASLRAA